MARLLLTIIKPKRRFDVLGYGEMIDEQLNIEAGKINELFGRATSTFTSKNKPVLTKTKPKDVGLDREITAGALKYYHGNGILSQINYGNERDILSFPPKKAMVFHEDYQPSTAASRALRPGKWEKSGPLWTSRRVHQIIKPRHIDKAVVKHRKGYFARIMRTRMKRKAKQTWI